MVKKVIFTLFPLIISIVVLYMLFVQSWVCKVDFNTKNADMVLVVDDYSINQLKDIYTLHQPQTMDEFGFECYLANSNDDCFSLVYDCYINGKKESTCFIHIAKKSSNNSETLTKYEIIDMLNKKIGKIRPVYNLFSTHSKRDDLVQYYISPYTLDRNGYLINPYSSFGYYIIASFETNQYIISIEEYSLSKQYYFSYYLNDFFSVIT